MLEHESGAPWGNRFGLLHIPISMEGKVVSPLEFVQRAKEISDRKKMSVEALLTSRLVGYLSRQV